MSELTTPIKIDIPGIGSIESADLYLKSEADKVIAKKDKLLRHHKYKRCLATARWCENAILGWMGWKESYSARARYLKVKLFEKWHNRWLELAERFK